MKPDGSRVWKALADPTRRQIVENLANGPRTTGTIVDWFAPDLGRTTIMKHLDILETARLIRVERRGRWRHNHLEKTALETICAWLEQRIRRHHNNLSQLKRIAEKRWADPSEEEKGP